MNRIHPIYKIPFKQVNYMDRVRKQRIRQAHPGKRLHIIRHCQVLKKLKADAALRLFFEREKALASTVRHVHVREALFGGRVENLAVSVELTPSEIRRNVTIQLVDVVSEYPYVQFVKRFPGRLHPRIICGDEIPLGGFNMSLKQVQEYFGLFSVFLLPPADCVFPTVPFRSHGRTLYGLCSTCMSRREQVYCHHNREAQRGWHATLNSPDLEQALKDGFRIIRCYEILDWGAAETTCDLFSGMIRHLIKGKVQSKTGAESIPPAKRESMIRAWAAIGVQLDPDGWKGNPALYQFYKVLLNSLWGKLAQNRIRRETKIIKSWEQLESIIENETITLDSIQKTSSDVVVCSISDVGDCSAYDPSFYNPFIATLVATYARLHITSFMRPIGCGNPYYLDTDSLIYKSDPLKTNDPVIDENKVLGSLVSELPKGTFIKV